MDRIVNIYSINSSNKAALKKRKFYLNNPTSSININNLTNNPNLPNHPNLNNPTTTNTNTTNNNNEDIRVKLRQLREGIGYYYHD